ncbi:34411_t:CDS:2 [Gigaspora margarita]|uniref:34411_t:CDS:1 n=1 Tax=Gigaspora margarita TaxID=4874 RepID=A0ABN7V2M9_GIGMA|nr:34411_t:CDS:2 [Gigaspora margarita]
MANDEIIQRKALGRTAQIGFLYDATRDTFHGTSIFRKELPPGLIKQVPSPHINLSFECEDTYKEKFDKLDVEGQLRLSVLSGLFSLKGTGEYLNNMKDSYKTVKGTLVCKMTSFTEYLEVNFDDLKPCITTDPFYIHDATHIVTSIRWGVNIMVSFECKNDDKKKRSEIKIAFESNLNNISSCIGASADFPLSIKVPKSFDEVKTFVAEIPSEMQKRSNGKGVPIEYTLYPLSKIAKLINLDIKIDRILTNLNEETISRVENIFDELSESKCMLKDLYDDAQTISRHVLDETLSKINLTMKNFKIEEAKFRSILAKCLIDIRSGRSEVSEIEGLLKKFQSGMLSINSTKRFIHKYRNISDKANLILSLKLKNVEYIDKDSTIEYILDLHYNDDIYIFLDNDEYSINGNLSPERIRFKELYEKSISSLSKFFTAELKVCTKIKGPNYPVIRHYINGKLANDSYYSEEEEINILLLGETGVGKSTFINAFVNYLKFDSLDSAIRGKMEVLIPFFFTITDENYENEQIVKIESDDLNDSNEQLEKGASSTQGCKRFVFPLTDSNRVINLIDTPGIGDTRGVEQDAKNFEDILMHISYYPYLNGICILLKPDQSRMNLILKYCLYELLSHLHKSAKDNIFFCFTHSRGSNFRPGAISTLLRKELNSFKDISGVEIKFNKDTSFYFDNESFKFLAQIKKDVSFTEEEKEDFKRSWEKSVNGLERLIEYVISRQPHKVKDTLSLNNSRKMVKLLLDILAIMQLREEMYIKKLEIDEEPLEFPRTICTSKKCTKEIQNDGKKQKIYSICCDNCHSKISTKTIGRICLLFCTAIGLNGKCKICGCSWVKHIHTDHIISCKPTHSINADIKFKISKKLSDTEQKKKWIEELQDIVDDIILEKELIIDIQNKFAQFLIQNAILHYNISFREYVDMLIDSEKKKFDDERIIVERIKVFENMKEESLKIEGIINAAAKSSSFDNLKIITKLEEDLYALPIYGSYIKNAKLKEEYNQENRFRYAEKHYSLFNDNTNFHFIISIDNKDANDRASKR